MRSSKDIIGNANEKYILSNRLIEVLIVIGCLILAGVGFAELKYDREIAESGMTETLNYMKQQCKYMERVKTADKEKIQNMLLENLFAGYRVDLNGIAFISDGKKILSSSEIAYIGKKNKQFQLLAEENEKHISNDIVRVRDEQGKHYYGKMTKYKGYDLYVFFSYRAVYRHFWSMLQILLLTYIAFGIGIAVIRHKGTQIHMRALNKQLNINNAISTIYSVVFLIDLLHNKIEVLKAPESLEAQIQNGSNAELAIQTLENRYMAKEFISKNRKFRSIKNMQGKLARKPFIEYTYQDIYGHWFRSGIIPQSWSKKGELQAVLLVARDITDQKEQEMNYQKKLVQTAKEAKQANIAKTDFLRRMSHDIRTPINGIRGMIEIGNHFPNDLKKQTECRKNIWKASGFLLELVNNILDMNKLESGKVTLDHKPFDLRELMEEVADLCQVQAKQKGITLKVAVDPHIHTQFIGSPLHIKQILMNIISNSVKYNKSGGFITVSCTEKSHDGTTASIEFICKDTGVGMSEEFQKHAFDIFTQEKESARTSYNGSGLGLSIVKKLIEKMNGTIRFESKQGIGTTFFIQIPFQISQEQVKKETAAEENSGTSMQGMQILLVEDNELNMEITEFMLKREGAIVTKAWNGKEAVELYKNSEPGNFDVILMDMMMPVMNGIEATKAIRSLDRPDAKNVFIIAVTANAFTEDKEQSIEAGINAHLSKPLDAKTLIHTIIRLKHT